MGSAIVSAAGGVASAFGAKSAASSAAAAQEAASKKQIKSQQKIHESSAADREKISQMVRADQGIAQQNLRASEQARMNIMSSLGQPGTYGPGSQSGPVGLGILAPTGLSGLSGRSRDSITGAGRITKSGTVSGEEVALGKKPKWKGRRDWEVEGVEMDADAMSREVQGTAGFRTVSGMVAEAEQLMNREGPLWDQLNNSVVGGIYESNAGFQRQAMEDVARNMARGGTARRVGLQMAQAMQVQEQVNRDRTGQLWRAKLGLEEYRVKQAQSNTTFSQDWASNQAGIRDSFQANLTNLQMFWASTMAPGLAGATVGAQSATQAGVGKASTGLTQAANTKAAAAGVALEGLIGAGKTILGAGIDKLFPGG